MPSKAVIKAIKALVQAGTILAQDVVDEARKKKGSPLYKYFESKGAWNDKKAAEEWRLSLARQLISSVKVQVITSEVVLTAPRYVSDPRAFPKMGGSYVSVSRIRTEEDSAREVLIAEFKRAAAALARAKNLSAAFDLENAIECIVKQVDELRAGLGSAEAHGTA